MEHDIGKAIQEGHTYLGIELSSTRITAVLIDSDCKPIALGTHTWENRLDNGIWTYYLDDIWSGIQICFARLSADVQAKYGMPLTTTGSIGVSAMMHGYLPLDRNGKLLTPYRTWRNTSTGEAAERLTEEFRFHIPQRWSIAHLYQAILNEEEHIYDIARLTTLAGYVHECLTGQNVLGVCDASGMFPIDGLAYDTRMLDIFDTLAKPFNLSWRLSEILPRVLSAGEAAGSLTAEGARLLDPTGKLLPGIPFCPPEGDAGTGMVATNSVAERMGNVSAGISVFATVVMERPLLKPHPGIDIIATPEGKPAAMVHCNNCTADLDAWIGLLHQAIELTGATVGRDSLYDAFYHKALEGDIDGGGLLSYNYVSGESLTGLPQGRPLFLRMPDSRLTLSNFARALLYSSVATLRLGMDILEEEQVHLVRMLGHGGLFKTANVGQRLMAAALKVPVDTLPMAGEGSALGTALLAAYKAQRISGETLEGFLSNRVFVNSPSNRVEPDPDDVKGFSVYMERYMKGLALERAAAEHLN